MSFSLSLSRSNIDMRRPSSRYGSSSHFIVTQIRYVKVSHSSHISLSRWPRSMACHENEMELLVKGREKKKKRNTVEIENEQI